MARPGGVLLPVLFGLSIATGSALAETLDQGQATAALKRIAEAARQLTYKGTFVFQHGEQVDTSRIYHLAEGNSEYEKLEMLDGPRREFIRKDNEIQCYYPEAKRVTREIRVSRRVFPALLPEHVASIIEQYEILRVDSERIAGYDSQALELEPKDSMRYGHKFWTDTRTGLLLRARMEDERHNLVEEVRFTQLDIGPFDRSLLKPTYKPGSDWRVDPAPQQAAESKPEVTEWTVVAPPGFRKLIETRRLKQGNMMTVHMVFSDGLSSVSVFIEPSAARSRFNPGPTRQGTINIYTRTVNEQVVTVLGEAPAPAVQQMADSVSYRGK